MTLSELHELARSCYGSIEAKSAYNGKILCKRFDPKKHPHLGCRRVISIWPEIKVKEGRYATPIICVYLDGKPEYDAEHKKEEE